MAKTPILTKDGLIRYDENIKDYIDTALEDKVSKTDIVDNLVSTATDAPLSAKQGKILKDTIDRLEVPGAMNYKGTLGTDGDITVLPSTYKRGDTYLVKTAGTYSEKECDVGDFLICVRDNILTVASIPTNYSNTYPAYIVYQIYNPQTGENGEVYFTAIKGGQWYFDVQDGQKQLYATGGAFGWSFSSNDNGVTWTEVNRDVWYGTLFTETETSAIKILHSTFNVYNNDNSIQYSINPYGLSGYATDWAIIQGTVDDKVSKSDIVDSLESDSTDAPLSAKQGKALKELIDNIEAGGSGESIAYELSSTNDSIVLSGSDGSESKVRHYSIHDIVGNQSAYVQIAEVRVKSSESINIPLAFRISTTYSSITELSMTFSGTSSETTIYNATKKGITRIYMYKVAPSVCQLFVAQNGQYNLGHYISVELMSAPLDDKIEVIWKNNGYGSRQESWTEISDSVQEQIDGKVSKSGDTMTGALDISSSSFPMINLTRLDSSWTAGIKFNNNLGVLGGFGMAEVDGSLLRYASDLTTKYNVLDTGNYDDYAVPKTGGTMTGTLTVKSNVNTPLLGDNSGDTMMPTPIAGTLQVSGDYMTSSTGLKTMKSFVGSYYGGTTSATNAWNSVISVRHRNGVSDGVSHGMYIRSLMNTANTNLIWNNQVSGTWESERTILDSKNYSSQIAAASTSASGLMTATMVTKLNGIAEGANKITVDSSLSSTSTNPVQNKAVYNSLVARLPLAGGDMTGSITFADGKGIVDYAKQATVFTTTATTVTPTSTIGTKRPVYFGTTNSAYVTYIRGAYVYVDSGSSNPVNSKTWQVLSDKRIKTNSILLNDEDKYLTFFDNLKPRNYNYLQEEEDANKSIGFYAQEVEEALLSAGLTNKDFDGLNILEDFEYGIAQGKDESVYFKKFYSISYEQFIPIIVNKVQHMEKEFNDKIAALEARIEELTGGTE